MDECNSDIKLLRPSGEFFDVADEPRTYPTPLCDLQIKRRYFNCAGV